MKININDPFQESEILDGLAAMQSRNDPGYAEAYNWYMQTYQPPVESDYYEGYQGQPQKPTFTEYQPNLAPTPGEFSIDPHLGIGGGFLRSLADKVFPPTMDEVQQRPYRVEDIGGGKTLGGATLQDAILGLTNTLTTGTGSEFLNPVINPYGTGLPQQTPIAETPFVPGEVALSDVEAFGDDFNYPPQQHPMQPVQDVLSGIVSQGVPMGLGFHEPFTPLPTQQERERHVGLTPQEATQQSWVPGLDRGEFAGLAQSFELMLPALATMLTTKNPAAALTMFAPPVFGKTFKEHTDAGKSETEALELAKKAVVFEVVPELLLWGPFKLVKTPLMAIFASIPAEAASEALTELGYIQDEIRNQGKTLTSEQIIARVKHAAKMGAYMGPAMGIGFSLPSMYNAIAEGKSEQVVRILRKHKAKMAAEGNTDVQVTILLDAAIEKIGDSTLSPEEHARALATFMDPASQGGIFERSGGKYTDWDAFGQGKPEGAGVAIFDPEVVIDKLTRELGGKTPSRSQVKERMKNLIDEEIGQHGGFRSAIQALGLSLDETDALYTRLLRDNKVEIDAWKKGDGAVYAQNASAVAADPSVDAVFDDIEAVDEWLAYLNRQRQQGRKINTAPLGQYVRHIMQTFKKQSDLNLTTAEASEIVDKLQSRVEGKDVGLATTPETETPLVIETPDTSQADLDAATAERQVQERILDEQTSSLERSTFGDTRFAKDPDIDNRRQTAIAKATAPYEDIRYSGSRMDSVKEDWKNNELDLRREYGNFDKFEQAEWDLNYEMWIDDIQTAELEDATEARVLQENILEEQLSGLERDFTGEPRFAKAADLDAAGILNRNVRNDFAKGPYKAIIGRPDEVEIRGRIKRLGNLYGPMGQKRGIEPGDRATAKEQAQNAIDNVDAFEEFMAPFEEQMQAQPAVSKTAAGRQKKYAERKGITVADILSYRDRGKTHPMEKKMSYSFAMDEINRLEEAGEATAEEAEARRRALNDLRNQLGGKMPPGAKRRATEIVYGIGDYANLEAWAYTETETKAMGERAEVARGAERVRGLKRTEKTEQELEEITGTDVTPTEMLQVASMREMESFDHLKTDEARLRWIREKEAMPASERDALDAFMKDIKGWNQKAYEAQVAAEREAQVEKVGVTKVEQTPAQRKAELKEMKEAQAPIEKRKHVQVEPDFFDSLLDTNFTMQGEAVPDGFMELTEEGEWSEVDDTDTRFGKAPDAPLDAADNIVGFWINIVESGDYSYPEMKRKLNELIESGELEESELKLANELIDSDIKKWNIDTSSRKTMSLKTKLYLKAHDKYKNEKYWDKDGKPITVAFAGPKVSNAEIDSLYEDLIRASIEFSEALNPGNPINRLAARQLSRGAYDTPLNIIKESIPKFKEIGEKYGLSFKTDFEHIKSLLALKFLEPKYGEEFSFPDVETGMDVGGNVIPLFEEPHDIKGQYTNNPNYAENERELDRRQRASEPHTEVIEFLKKGRDGNWKKINKKSSTPAEKFYNAMVKKYGSNVIEKLEEHKKILNEKGNSGVFATVARAQASWERHGAGEATTIEEQILDDLARKKPEISKETRAKIRELHNEILVLDQATNPASEAASKSFARFAKRAKGDSYEEHFNKSFWYTLTSYLWGKPVQAIRDFNKLSRFGQAKADIPAADEIADEVQRAHSSTQRAEALVYGTDIVQDTSIMTGQFYTRLAQIFSRVTARLGDIEKTENQILVDVLTGKIRIEEIDNAETREAAKLLRELVQDVYNYAQEETKGLKKPLDLRGHGDTLLPRVWNIEFLATRRGKAKFLKAIRAAITDPATGSSILEDSELTVEDLFNVVVNSGGFVQGDWTNLKADQTRDQKEIERDMRAQEYLDALPTEALIDEDLVMIDLQAIIPRFLQKAVERTEYSKRFGVNDEILRAKIKEGLEQIKVHNAKVLKLDKTDTSLTYIDPRAFEKSIWDMARILRNKYGYDMANMQTRAWLQRVVNFEVVAKLPLVTLASMPELFTPMLRGDVRADKWIVDLMMGLSWAGYKGMNGISKLLLNKHLPAMRKMSKDIGGIGVVSDMQLLRELGIAEIQAMGDSVSTRYANPNFARGGLRAGARTTIAGRIPKKVRAVFNMQTYMQATLLTTLTEMQQLMALRNFQRHMAKRVKFVQKNAGKDLKGRRLRLFKQFSKDMADFGLPQNIDLSTPAGEAEFNAGAIRFVDQVITRPNDATTSKAFKNPLTAPIFLFKRFLTVFGNTLMTAVGNDIATKVDNVEKAKQVGRIVTTVMAMYGAVMFAEIIRGAIKGDLDDDDMTVTGGDFRTFVRRVDRTGLLSAPGAMLLNLSFPYKRGWWDSPEARIWGELGGPIGGDLSALMKTGFDRRPGSAQRLIRQMIPMSKKLIALPPKKKRSTSKAKW